MMETRRRSRYCRGWGVSQFRKRRVKANPLTPSLRGTVHRHTLALRRAQRERKNLSECRPSTAQAEPVEAGFAHLSTVPAREGGTPALHSLVPLRVGEGLGERFRRQSRHTSKPEARQSPQLQFAIPA